jgi:hypothetical protein
MKAGGRGHPAVLDRNSQLGLNFEGRHFAHFCCGVF